MKLKFTAAIGLMAAAAVCAKDYSGAEVYSKQQYSYGRYEARIQMAAVSGSVSSMFLYQNGSEQESAERWVEIDIEILGNNANQMQSNIISGKGGKTQTPTLHPLPSATNEGFHTYAIERTPDYVRWLFDDVEIRRTNKGEELDQVANLIGEQGIRFNIWSAESEGWVGPFDPSDLPIFEFIDWVKAYSYTPGEGDNGSDFTLVWADNFNTFDTNRWAKGDYTFDENRADFKSKNVYTQDGMMILALTPKGQEKFTGKVPKDEITISDFESGTALAASGQYWYAYTDAGSEGKSTITNEEDTEHGGYKLVKAGDNGTAGMLAMEGIVLDKGENENAPNVNLAIDFHSDKSAYTELGECDQISYDYKGTAHSFKVVMAGDTTGKLTAYNRHAKAIPASSDWTTITIPWSELVQGEGWGKTVDLDPANISGIILEVAGAADPDYLYTDNFKCVGMTVFNPEPASSATAPESSSSEEKAVSSSSEKVPASSSAKKAASSSSKKDADAIYATANTAAFHASVQGRTLSIGIANSSRVQVQVFDIMGHLVKTDVKRLSAGTHSVSLQSLPQGSYVVRIASTSGSQMLRANLR